MVDVRVNFDYEAEQDDELTIKIGDIIKNVAMPDGGWWEGELDGKKGLFPDNFVEIIKNPDKEKDRDKEKNTADIKASHRLSTKGHVAELANKLRDGVHVGGGPPKKRESLNKKRLKAKVAFAYAPENDDELALEVGEVVEILKQEEEGWWEGALNGKTGLFPSNFVELVDENGEEPEKTDEPKKEGDFKEIRGKKIQGVGLGNIFGGGPIKLRATGAGSVKKVGPPETVERKKEEKQEMAPAREKSVEKAIVRFSYAAENDDELSLQVGDVVMILDKELEDSGWWKGEVHGKSGVFPDNFVEIMPPDEAKPKKPPPPAAGPSTKTQIKPDKSHHIDTTHNDNIKKNEESPAPEKPPPIIPSKKPVLPPPVGRKPLPAKPAESHTHTKSHSQTDDQKTNKILNHDKKESLLRSDHMSFDGVQSSTEKLSHPTANRAKLPNRRPPSQIFLHTEEEKANDKDHDKPGKSIITHKEEKEEKKDESPKEEVKKRVPTATVNHGPTSNKRHSYLASAAKHEETTTTNKIGAGAGHTTTASGAGHSSAGHSGVSQAIVDELKKEIKELKANTVSKAAYNELKADFEKLRKEMEMIRSSFGKKFMDLMNEVDDEKKTRLNTQVEIDRIKRLVAESHI